MGKRRKYKKKRKQMRLFKSPVPMSMTTKLRYQDTVTIDAGASALAGHIIAANGCFKPDITATGHQPRGFDQLMALYDHYTVIGSKITASFYNRDGTVPLTVCVALRDGNSITATDLNDYLEGGNVISRFLTPEDTSAALKTITKGFSARKFLGRSHPMADPDLKGGATFNPTEGAFFHLCVANTTGSADPTSTYVNFNIDYIVTFTEPKVPAQS